MGIYNMVCQGCQARFQWFSGALNQLCDKCNNLFAHTNIETNILKSDLRLVEGQLKDLGLLYQETLSENRRLESINKHVDPGTCDSADGMVKIIKERDELKAGCENYIKTISQLEADFESARATAYSHSRELSFRSGRIDALEAELEIEKNRSTNLSIKIQRTVSAAYHALLEMSAWLGIPDKKRETHIDALMENVKYCAEYDLRHVDESQAIQSLKAELDRAKSESTVRYAPPNSHSTQILTDRSELIAEIERLKGELVTLKRQYDHEQDISESVVDHVNDLDIQLESEKAKSLKYREALEQIARQDHRVHILTGQRIARQALEEDK